MFSKDDDVISNTYKDSLSKFIHRLPINAISCIILKGYCDSTETDNRAASLAFNRALSTFNFLNRLGIPPDKIAIKNTPEILFHKNESHNQENTSTELKKAEISVYW